MNPPYFQIPGYCGHSVARSVLELGFGLSFPDTEIKDMMDSERERNMRSHGRKYDGRKHGTHLGVDDIHWKYLAQHLSIDYLMRIDGDCQIVDHLLENGAYPIVHRPFERGDRVGHYVFVKERADGLYKVWDPSNTPLEKRGLLLEGRDEFMEKWRFCDERFLFAFLPRIQGK